MKYFTQIDGVEREYTFEHDGDDLIVHHGDRQIRCAKSKIGDGAVFSLILDGRSYDCMVEFEGQNAVVQVTGERIDVHVEDARERAANLVSSAKTGGARTVEAAMPGVVVSVDVAPGDSVEDGQTLVVLDAMKMQNPIGAEGAGVVAKVHVAVGDTVAAGATLVDLEDPAGDS